MTQKVPSNKTFDILKSKSDYYDDYFRTNTKLTQSKILRFEISCPSTFFLLKLYIRKMLQHKLQIVLSTENIAVPELFLSEVSQIRTINSGNKLSSLGSDFDVSKVAIKLDLDRLMTKMAQFLT